MVLFVRDQFHNVHGKLLAAAKFLSGITTFFSFSYCNKIIVFQKSFSFYLLSLYFSTFVDRDIRGR